MRTSSAHLSATPVSTPHRVIGHRNCRGASSHLTMGARASAERDFEGGRSGQETVVEATLEATAPVSRLGRAPGYATLDVLMNGKALIER
ncbi:hypothetical protein [Streptomyces sp. NPDC056796]|uniref:hypothetical protein n=1 Tax=Streptomyces sp. NPDC056796 TaxID=3345947 RepID=UPI0036AD3707